MAFQDYFTDPTLNLSVGGLSIAEGMPRANVNNVLRQICADGKLLAIYVDTAGGAVSTASATVGVYPNAAASYVPKGAISFSFTAGSGGTNSVNNLATFSGGTLAANPVILYDVVGGAVTNVRMTFGGLFIGAGTPTMPTVILASGGTGTITLAGGLLYAPGQGYWAQSTDGLSIVRYANVAGAAALDATVNPIPNMAGVSALYASLIANATAATTNATAATTAANSATTAASALTGTITAANASATAAATAAQLARDEAIVAANMFPNAAAGIAATNNGQYFTVPGSDANTYATMYKNVSGVATFLGSYASKAAVDAAALSAATYVTLAAFKASNISNLTAQLVGIPGISNGQFTWETANAPYTADDLNIIKADSTALSVGAWVRQNSNSITHRLAATSAVTQTQADINNEIVSVKRFGAKCDTLVNADGSFTVGTDDTAAVQAAINYALSLNRPVDIVFPGPGLCRITSPLKINRRIYYVGVTPLLVGELRFRGLGGGVFVSTAITIFTSDLSNLPAIDPSEPVSEQFHFDCFNFVQSDRTLNAYIANEKIIRVKFTNCYGLNIKAVNSPIYLQSWYFIGCNFRFWQGSFFKAAGNAYDLKVIGSIFEFGGLVGAVAGSHGFDVAGMYGCQLSGNNFEGSFGSFVRQQSCSGLGIRDNYTEGNHAPDYVLSYGGGVANGIAFEGNLMDPSASGGWSVIVGDVRGLTSGGNRCLGKLFDVTGTRLGGFISTGDSSQTDELFSDSRFWQASATGTAPREDAITAHAGGGQASARKLTKPINRVATVAASGDSVALPPSDEIAFGTGKMVVVINAGANSLNVFYDPADTANFGSPSSAFAIPSGEARTFVCGAAGRYYLA